MNLKAKSFFFAGGLCIAALGVAWREGQLSHAGRMALAAMAEKRAGLGLQIRGQEDRASSLGRERENLQAVLDGLRSMPPKARPAYKPVHLVGPDEAARNLVMATAPWQDIALQENPGLQARYLASERTNLALSYGPFFQALGLTPEQADKFKDLMTEHAGKMLDLRLIALAQDSGEHEPANAALQQQADDQLRAAQADLLGEAGYQQLQQYERTLPARDQANTLAGALALTNTPLSATQAEQITQVIANASSGYQNGGKADLPMPGNWEFIGPLMLAHKTIAETVDWDAVLVQSHSVLSDAQFGVFEAYVTKNQAVVHLFNLIQASPGDPMAGFAFGRR